MIRPTTILSFPRLSRLCGERRLFWPQKRCEHTNSFKFRGAWYMVSTVSHKHLMTSSSGNFGQALAFACQQLNKRSTVVMPKNSVTVRAEAIEGIEGVVDLIDLRKTVEPRVWPNYLSGMRMHT